MNFIKTIARKILETLPVRNVILFESKPDFSDSPFYVYKEMCKQGLDSKYKLLWVKYDDVETPQGFKSLNKKNKILFSYYTLVSKVIICNNRFLCKRRKGQTSFYLMHGSPLKDTRGYYIMPKGIDYIVSAGKGINERCAKAFETTSERFFPLGYPRNDDLLKERINMEELFGKYDQYIAWYPTVRQFSGGFKTECSHTIPLIHSNDNLLKLNEIANKTNTLIIIKPHFAQDLKYITEVNCSNIKIIDNSFFVKHNITSYEFVGSTDALISDYSSIYYDYLLCDKPIGLVLEDIDEYRKNPGLIEEFESFTQGGVKIYNINDLISFINDVASNIDNLKDVRNKLCQQFNTTYPDSSITKKVVEFIKDKANL